MSEGDARQPRQWLMALLALLIVAIVYAPSLGGPFLWDDTLLVTDSPQIASLDWRRILLQPFWVGAPGVEGSTAYYRPLSTLSLALDYRVHADNPAGYHLTNVVCHLAACGFMLALLRRRGVGAGLSLLLATLWALLPRLSEAAAWVSGRTDVLAGLFALAALLAYRPEAKAPPVLAAALATLAVLSKETGLAAFVALLLFEWRSAAERSAPSKALRWACLGLPLLLYLSVRFSAGAAMGGADPGLRLGVRVLTVLEALARYAWMLFDPFQPSSLIGRQAYPDQWLAALGGGVLMALGYAAYRLRRAQFETVVYVVVAATSLVMVLHVIPLPVSVTAADRYLYLPSAALVLALAPSLARAAKRWRWVTPAVLAVLAGCGARTFERVRDFTDAGRFWAAAVHSAPRDPLSYVGLGSVAYDAGLLTEAHALYARGLAVPHGRLRVALDNTALLSAVTGRRNEAALLGDELVAKSPNVASYRLRRATIAFNALDLELAQKHARQALALDPQLQLARLLLGWLAQAKAAGVGQPGSTVPTATALRVDMQALRYPELLATVRAELTSPRSSAPIVREAVEYVIARGRPEDARELVELYVAAVPIADAERLRDAAALRLQTAADVRGHLQTLPPP